VSKDRELKGNVRAFDLVEKRSLWQCNLIQDIRDRYQLDEPRQVLPLMGGASGRLITGRARHLFGVSLSTGDLLWKAPAHVPYYWPQIKDERIYVWTTAPPGEKDPVVDRFLILDERSGEILLEKPLSSYGKKFEERQDPKQGTLGKHHIIFTTRTGLMAAFRLSDGELAWTHQHHDEFFRLVVEENRVYATCADGTVVGFEWEGGEI
jgi:outer membrane protein assembly factor BamB